MIGHRLDLSRAMTFLYGSHFVNIKFNLILFNSIVVLYSLQTLKFAPRKKEIINELIYESSS
jgi:hypothetical protein